MNIKTDTIAAIATALGDGGIAVVRVSGEDAPRVLSACFRPAGGAGFSHAQMRYGHVVEKAGDVIDEAMAVIFYAPNSYTREHVAEIQCHGGALQVKRVLERVLAENVRLADPGEFTRRAFLSGRLDLSKAEAVMQLISAGSDAAARAAVNQLKGGVFSAIQKMADRLTDVIALIEAGDDFPEEIEEQATADAVMRGIGEVESELARISDARTARMLREGVTVALVGRPNTGKSSLMNRLLGTERAIVTEQPGTTRDILTERMTVDGFAVTLVDTAGQRAATDEVERIGVKRAEDAQRAADMVLLVIDGSTELTPEDRRLIDRADERTRVVLSKYDLPRAIDEAQIGVADPIRASSLTGEGMDAIARAIADCVKAPAAIEGQLTVERHLALARRALDALGRASKTLTDRMPIDICAVDLMEALESLHEVTGINAGESVIDRVFSSFCVGK